MKSMIALLACVAFAAAIDDGQWHPTLDGSYRGMWNPIADGSLAGNWRWSHPWISPIVHRLKRDLITSTGVVLHDDGQWKPALDGSWLGSGNLMWGKGVVAPHAIIAHRFKRDLITPAGVVLHDDGQWKPALDGSWLGSGNLMWGKGVVAPHAIIAHRFKRALVTSPWAAMYHPYMMNAHAMNVPLDTPHVAVAKTAQIIQQATEGARNVMGGGIPLALPADTPEVAYGKMAHAIAHSNQKAMTTGGWYHPMIM